MKYTKTQQKVKRLLDRGVTNPETIARKMGYKGGALTSGIAKMKQVIADVEAKRDPEIERAIRRMLHGTAHI